MRSVRLSDRAVVMIVQEPVTGRVTRQDVMRCLLNLPWQDQAIIYRQFGEFLGAGGEGSARGSVELERREEALRDLRAAAEHLGLADRWPTVGEYRRAREDLGLALNSTRRGPNRSPSRPTCMLPANATNPATASTTPTPAADNPTARVNKIAAIAR